MPDTVEAVHRRSRIGKDEEFSEFMAARQGAVVRTAFLLTGDRGAAEDLAQVAFAKLYLSWDKVKDRGALDGYVRRIVVNETNSLWRRPFKRKERVKETLPDAPVYDRHDEGQSEALWRFVQTLPARQRSVIVLRYYEQLSDAEIADVLDVSVGTVKSQASRALVSLRERRPSSLEHGDPAS